MQTLTRPSYAKINLTLRVTGLRADGFHELESVVSQVNLSDRIAVTPREDDQIVLTCDTPGIPTDETNLAYRAAAALREAAGVHHGVDIALTKRIPAGAGLGGGSSNAATTLQLLNEFWLLNLDRRKLAEIGAALGSDVPLFMHRSPCIMRGRGELVEELDVSPSLWAAIIMPELHCSTPAVYKAWDRMAPHPPRPDMADVNDCFGSAGRMMDMLFNDLETPAFDVEPRLAELSREIVSATGLVARLTGSGAALFRLFDNHQAAARYALDVGMATAVRTDIVALHGQP